jgi:uncharacterized protein YuzE
MKLTYDPRRNIAYMYLRPRVDSVQVQTVRLSDEMNVDIAPNGEVYGIELLNANAQLKSGEHDLVVINEAAGDRQSVPLA